MKHLTVLMAMLAVAGCNSPDQRLSRLVRDTTAEQASQNRAVTELNREAAASHQAVVEAVREAVSAGMPLHLLALDGLAPLHWALAQEIYTKAGAVSGVHFYYTKVNGIAPAEADMQRYSATTSDFRHWFVYGQSGRSN